MRRLYVGGVAMLLALAACRTHAAPAEADDSPIDPPTGAELSDAARQRLPDSLAGTYNLRLCTPDCRSHDRGRAPVTLQLVLDPRPFAAPRVPEEVRPTSPLWSHVVLDARVGHACYVRQDAGAKIPEVGYVDVRWTPGDSLLTVNLDLEIDTGETLYLRFGGDSVTGRVRRQVGVPLEDRIVGAIAGSRIGVPGAQVCARALRQALARYAAPPASNARSGG